MYISTGWKRKYSPCWKKNKLEKENTDCPRRLTSFQRNRYAGWTQKWTISLNFITLLRSISCCHVGWSTGWWLEKTLDQNPYHPDANTMLLKMLATSWELQKQPCLSNYELESWDGQDFKLCFQKAALKSCTKLLKPSQRGLQSDVNRTQHTDTYRTC